jgi:tetratricopeptide (TPR) repeat protein
MGYHAVNVALHAGASVLVYALASRWLSFGGAAIAALLFAVHPLHVEAVANIVGRAELLAACGVLAALLLHTRRSAWAPVAFAIALLSKEHAIVTPGLAILLDLGAPGGTAAGARSVRRFAWPLYAAYAAVAVAWMLVLAWLFRDSAFAAVEVFWQTMDAPTRWLTMLGVVTVWVRLWFFPFALSADYSPQVTLAWPANAASATVGVLMLALAGVLGVAAWRRRSRCVAMAVAWLAIATLPVANILVPTGVIVAERTLYLSSVGAVLLCGAAAEWLARRSVVVAIAGVAVVGLAFGARVWTRTPVWESNRALLVATSTTHPHASWTHVLIGRVYDGNGAYELAVQEYRRAIALFDGSPIAWAAAIESSSRLPDVARTESLIADARRRVGAHYLVLVAHAGAALRGNRFSEALRAAREASEAEPDSARARVYAARAFAGLGMNDSAVAQLRRIHRGDPMQTLADSIRASLPPTRW